MYNVKLRIRYADSGKTNTVVIGVRGISPKEATDSAYAITSKWQNVSEVKVIEVSTRPMNLQKYLVVVNMFYSKRPPKPIKVSVVAESPEEAGVFADEVIQSWQNWREYEIIKVEAV